MTYFNDYESWKEYALRLGAEIIGEKADYYDIEAVFLDDSVPLTLGAWSWLYEEGYVKPLTEVK